MKLSFASVAYATVLALSATVADAVTGTTFTSIAASTIAAAPGTSKVTLVAALGNGDDHTAAGDTLKVTLPESFDADLTPAGVLTGELEVNCVTAGQAGGEVVAMGTDYVGTYDATTRVLTLTHKTPATAKLCIEGAVTIKFEKATLRANEFAVDSVKLENSIVTAEATTPVTGPATTATASVTALTGTSQPTSFTTTDNTLTISYTPGAVVTSGSVTVALHGYAFDATVGAASVCSVGGTDAATVIGTAVDGYAFVTFPSAFVATAQDIKCTKVTRAAGGTAKTGGVQLWLADAKAGFANTVASTTSPTPAPATIAANGACVVGSVACVANTTCAVTNSTLNATVGTCQAPTPAPTTGPPTAAPVTPTAAADHSSALSLSSAPLMLAALMVGLGSMN